MVLVDLIKKVVNFRKWEEGECDGFVMEEWEVLDLVVVVKLEGIEEDGGDGLECGGG